MLNTGSLLRSGFPVSTASAYLLFSSPVASTPLLLSLFDATVPILGWHRLTYRIILKLKICSCFWVKINLIEPKAKCNWRYSLLSHRKHCKKSPIAIWQRVVSEAWIGIKISLRIASSLYNLDVAQKTVTITTDRIPDFKVFHFAGSFVVVRYSGLKRRFCDGFDRVVFRFSSFRVFIPTLHCCCGADKAYFGILYWNYWSKYIFFSGGLNNSTPAGIRKQKFLGFSVSPGLHLSPPMKRGNFANFPTCSKTKVTSHY